MWFSSKAACRRAKYEGRRRQPQATVPGRRPQDVLRRTSRLPVLPAGPDRVGAAGPGEPGGDAARGRQTAFDLLISTTRSMTMMKGQSRLVSVGNCTGLIPGVTVYHPSLPEAQGEG